jgi:hypothetical protein
MFFLYKKKIQHFEPIEISFYHFLKVEQVPAWNKTNIFNLQKQWK